MSKLYFFKWNSKYQLHTNLLKRYKIQIRDFPITPERQTIRKCLKRGGNNLIFLSVWISISVITSSTESRVKFVLVPKCFLFLFFKCEILDQTEWASAWLKIIFLDTIKKKLNIFDWLPAKRVPGKILFCY